MKDYSLNIGWLRINFSIPPCNNIVYILDDFMRIHKIQSQHEVFSENIGNYMFNIIANVVTEDFLLQGLWDWT